MERIVRQRISDRPWSASIQRSRRGKARLACRPRLCCVDPTCMSQQINMTWMSVREISAVLGSVAAVTRRP